MLLYINFFFKTNSHLSQTHSKKIYIFFTPLPVFWFFGLHLQHIEVPRLGIELDQQLLAYVTATATPDP